MRSERSGAAAPATPGQTPSVVEQRDRAGEQRRGAFVGADASAHDQRDSDSRGRSSRRAAASPTGPAPATMTRGGAVSCRSRRRPRQLAERPRRHRFHDLARDPGRDEHRADERAPLIPGMRPRSAIAGPGRSRRGPSRRRRSPLRATSGASIARVLAAHEGRRGERLRITRSRRRPTKATSSAAAHDEGEARVPAARSGSRRCRGNP